MKYFALLCGKLFFSTPMKQLISDSRHLYNSLAWICLPLSFRKKILQRSVSKYIVTSSLSNTTNLMNLSLWGLKEETQRHCPRSRDESSTNCFLTLVTTHYIARPFTSTSLSSLSKNDL